MRLPCPLDTTQRRPWIDWIHTEPNQTNIIQPYVKWCDQPFNFASVPEALYRAYRIMNSEPKAPVYLSIDTSIQETVVDNPFTLEEKKLLLLPLLPTANQVHIQEISIALLNASFPLIIADYFAKDADSLRNLIRLVELLAIPVIDLGGRYNFPNNHSMCLNGIEDHFYQKVDFILALDVHDLYGALGEIRDDHYHKRINANVKIIHITLGESLISKSVADYQRLYPVDALLAADSKQVIVDLHKNTNGILTTEILEKINNRNTYINKEHQKLRRNWFSIATENQKNCPLETPAVLYNIWEIIKEEDWLLTNFGSVEIGKWIKKIWEFSIFGCHIGESGGAGLGYGLGASIGAALAYKNSTKLCINVQADGDFLYTPSALWTAAHYSVPLLTIIMNNRVYGNSKEHAFKIACQRQRSPENCLNGTSFENPEVDFCALSTSLGVKSSPIITHLSEIQPALKNAISFIKSEKNPYLIEILIK